MIARNSRMSKLIPQGESREEMVRRQIAEVKEYMDLEDHGMTGESANVTEESSTRTGEEDDGTTSSSSKRGFSIGRRTHHRTETHHRRKTQ